MLHESSVLAELVPVTRTLKVDPPSARENEISSKTSSSVDALVSAITDVDASELHAMVSCATNVLYGDEAPVPPDVCDIVTK